MQLEEIKENSEIRIYLLNPREIYFILKGLMLEVKELRSYREFLYLKKNSEENKNEIIGVFNQLDKISEEIDHIIKYLEDQNIEVPEII